MHMPREPRPSELRARAERGRSKQTEEKGPLLVVHVRLEPGWYSTSVVDNALDTMKAFGDIELAELRELPEKIDVMEQM
jgi:hypothetical protein